MCWVTRKIIGLLTSFQLKNIFLPNTSWQKKKFLFSCKVFLSREHKQKIKFHFPLLQLIFTFLITNFSHNIPDNWTDIVGWSFFVFFWQKNVAEKLEFYPFWQDVFCKKVFFSLGHTTFLITEHNYKKIDFLIHSVQLNGAIGMTTGRSGNKFDHPTSDLPLSIPSLIRNLPWKSLINQTFHYNIFQPIGYGLKNTNTFEFDRETAQSDFDARGRDGVANWQRCRVVWGITCI